MRWLMPLVTAAALAAACGSDSVVNDGHAGGGGSDAATTVSSSLAAGGSSTTLAGAAGVQIQWITINQGVERLLSSGGIPQRSTIPIIADRPALVRVYYTASAQQFNQSAIGRLTLGDGTVVEVPLTLKSKSIELDYDSSANFVLDGSQLTEPFRYSVGILQPGEDFPNARHPVDTLEEHPIEPRNVLRVMLVPYRYDFDGSGRLPDTSAEMVAAYRDRFMQLYPVSDVEVTVHAPVPWSQEIHPFGEGWQDVMQDIYSLRLSEGATDVYYYGVFNPQPSIGEFCNQGCTLGVTTLNDEPVNVGQPELRWAVGVGYPENTFNTSAHEIGHAHGRLHVDCGPGVAPGSIDPDFPHSPSSIGVWGWDIVNEKLVNPNATDIMGYCSNKWISDYNFAAIHNRAKNVNLASLAVEPQLLDIVSVASIDDDGRAVILGQIEDVLLGGNVEDVLVTDRDGTRRTVAGHYHAFDHLPGGWLLVPSRGQTASIEASLPSHRVVASPRLAH